MEIIKGYKFKYLDQIIKRKLTKFFFFWKLAKLEKFLITSRPFKSAVISPCNTSPLTSRKVLKTVHRATHSYLDKTPNETIKSTPSIHSKVGHSVFDQIRNSLQSKASSIETKVATVKEAKVKKAKKKLFDLEKPKHKRTLTQPDCNLAVVSGKTEKQSIFKYDLKK